MSQHSNHALKSLMHASDRKALKAFMLGNLDELAALGNECVLATQHPCAHKGDEVSVKYMCGDMVFVKLYHRARRSICFVDVLV